MGRRRLTEFDVVDIRDENFETLERYRRMNLDSHRKLQEKMLHERIREVYEESKKLEKRAMEEEGGELLDLQSAYDYLRSNGVYLSFRAFGGRIERGAIPYIKIGRKRYITKSVLDDIIRTSKDYLPLMEAYEVLSRHEKELNLRAFIGRVDKNLIPSVKIGGRRFIPKTVVESLTKIADSYYTVSQAVKRLQEENVGIKKNALERRLDRGRVPHIKYGGKRFIPKWAIEKIIENESKRR